MANGLIVEAKTKLSRPIRKKGLNNGRTIKI